MDLNGRVAIVTGSGGLGCGRAIARRFAQGGAAVVVSDINDAGGLETVHQIEASGGRAAFQRADVGVDGEVRALVAFAETTFGGLDVLVNDASAPYRPEAPLGHWDEIIHVDLLGPMFAVLHAVNAMRKRGGGAIVNISSTSALGHGRKHSGSPAYDVAKAGVLRLTTTLAWLRQREGVRVNCLVPDWVATPEVKSYWDGLTPQQRKDQGVPEVLTTLDEIADAVTRLATDETLAGRVLVWWNSQPPQLLPAGDPGYACLELLKAQR
jgi:NAD(P)-dependent dehydrogenase (short-subunit alcohol dehydrogenase family)